MAKKSVDEIWAQLNAKPASASRSNINLNSFGGLPGIRTTERVVSDRGGWRGRSGGTEVSPNREMDDEGFRAVALTAVKTGAAYDPMKAGVSPEERDAFVVSCFIQQASPASLLPPPLLPAGSLLRRMLHNSPSLLHSHPFPARLIC